MPEYLSPFPALTVRIIYEDFPHFSYIEARIVAGDWSGITWVDHDPASLAEEARDLLAWTPRPCEGFGFEIGSESDGGWLSLRFYTVDRAGHLACHVRLATKAESGRPEGVRRLALEFPTEPALVDRFACQLAALAETLTGEAVLAGI